MKRLSVLCLLFLGLTAVTTSEKLRVLPLKNGMTQISRNLALQETIQSVSSSSYSSASFFSVIVDLGPDYLNKRGINPKIANTQMAIIISSNETVFTGEDCSIFSSMSRYSCDHGEDDVCSTEESGISINLPFLTVESTSRIIYNKVYTKSVSPVSIVNGSWALATTPLLMNDCTNPEFPDYPNLAYEYKKTYPGAYDSYGWIGLGTEGSASSNFKTPHPIFSTHLNAKDKTGDLIFGFDDTRISSRTPVSTLQTDEQWRMSLTSIKYGDGKAYTYQPPVAMTLVFDLQVQGIHVPPSVYDKLRSIWKDVQDSDYCDSDTYQCRVQSKRISAISSITFTLANGATFSIDPRHIFSYDNYNYWDAEVGTVSTKLSGSEYVVLGYRAMSQFYSVFEKTTTGNTITLYNPVPQVVGGSYTAPPEDNSNGGDDSNGGNTTNPDHSGDDDPTTPTAPDNSGGDSNPTNPDTSGGNISPTNPDTSGGDDNQTNPDTSSADGSPTNPDPSSGGDKSINPDDTSGGDSSQTNPDTSGGGGNPTNPDTSSADGSPTNPDHSGGDSNPPNPGNSGGNGSLTNPGNSNGDENGDGNGNHLIYGGAAAVVIILIAVITCYYLKSKPKPPAENKLSVHLSEDDQKDLQRAIADCVPL